MLKLPHLQEGVHVGRIINPLLFVSSLGRCCSSEGEAAQLCSRAEVRVCNPSRSHNSSVLLRIGQTALHHGCISKYPRRDCFPQVSPRPRPDELRPRRAVGGGAEALPHLCETAAGVRKLEAVRG